MHPHNTIPFLQTMITVAAGRVKVGADCPPTKEQEEPKLSRAASSSVLPVAVSATKQNRNCARQSWRCLKCLGTAAAVINERNVVFACPLGRFALLGDLGCCFAP